MKRNLTEVVFILDRSGSMSGLERDTIGGYNSLLEKQKQEESGVRLIVFKDENSKRSVSDIVKVIVE